MIKKSLLTIAIICSFGAATTAFSTEEANQSSQVYVDSVLSHLDQSKEISKNISDLADKESDAEKVSKASAKRVSTAVKIIDGKQKRLDSLPGKITRRDESIVTKEVRSSTILDVHFPEVATVDAAISLVSSKKENLEQEKERLQTSLGVIERDYDGRILGHQNVINTKSATRRKLQDTLEGNRTRIVNLRAEVKKYRDAADKFAETKNDPGFPERLQTARQAYRSSEAKRAAENRNCVARRNFGLGRYKDRSETCINFRRNRDRRNHLNAINNGSLERVERQAARAKRQEAQGLANQQESLRERIGSLNTDIQISTAAIERLKEDKSTATRPTREALAQVRFDLESLKGDITQVNILKTLREEIKNHKSDIVRYTKEQKTLPPEIATLTASLEGLQETARTDAELLNTIIVEKESMVTAAKETVSLIENNRSTMLKIFEADQPLLVPANPETPEEIAELLYESRDWSVFATDNDTNWNRASCKTKTTELLVIEELEVSAELSVVNLLNDKDIYSEPMVTLTITNPNGLDLNGYKTAKLTTSSSSKPKKTTDLDLVYSMSDEGKLVFLAKLGDRKDLIKQIELKSSMYVHLENVNRDASRIKFSLRGSQNSLISSSKNSLKKACGGIATSNF